jgi:hypothetical protein
MSGTPRDEDRGDRRSEAEGQRGVPGEGAGRREVVEKTGVYPASAGEAPPDAEIRTMGEWGRGTYEADDVLPPENERRDIAEEESDSHRDRE